MKEYVVTRDAWIYGNKYKENDIVHLNEKQAKYELLSGTIRERSEIKVKSRLESKKDE